LFVTLGEGLAVKVLYLETEASDSRVLPWTRMKKTEYISETSWLARELEPNRKLFPDHISSILDAALMIAGSLHA
jgi:hypothetical protein